MLKWFFWCLLALNALLLAYSQGYLGNAGQARREPARMLNEQNASQLRLLSPAEAMAAQERAKAAALAAAPGTASAADVAANQADTKVDTRLDTKLETKLETRANKEKPPAPARIACLEIGNFDSADAKRFETRLNALALGERQSRRNVPGLDASNNVSSKASGYMVLIPPQANRDSANRKARELEQLGVTNYYILPDSSAQRWAISLGVFKLESGAQHLLEALQKQGVHSARIAPRMSSTSQLAFQLRDLDAKTKTRLDQIRLDFSEQQIRSCK